MGTAEGHVLTTVFNTAVAKTKMPAGRIVTAQIVVSLTIAALCLLIDTVAAWSSLLGGFACICPGLYAAIRLKKAVHAEEASGGGSGLGPVLMGELGRIVLSAVIFIVVFMTVKPLNVLSFFGTFIVLQLCHVLIPLVDSLRMRKIL